MAISQISTTTMQYTTPRPTLTACSILYKSTSSTSTESPLRAENSAFHGEDKNENPAQISPKHITLSEKFSRYLPTEERYYWHSTPRPQPRVPDPLLLPPEFQSDLRHLVRVLVAIQREDGSPNVGRITFALLACTTTKQEEIIEMHAFVKQPFIGFLLSKLSCLSTVTACNFAVAVRPRGASNAPLTCSSCAIFI